MVALLSGVRVNVDAQPGPERAAFRIGAERYLMEQGVTEYVLLARLTAGDRPEARPVFLFCGRRAITTQAATRYLARHHARPTRKHGHGPFVLLLKVVNSQAYGSDVVELVGDVTRAATTSLPEGTEDPEPAAGRAEPAAVRRQPARNRPPTRRKREVRTCVHRARQCG